MVVDKKLFLDLYAKSRDIDCCARHVGKDGREKIWDTECVELVSRGYFKLFDRNRAIAHGDCW